MAYIIKDVIGNLEHSELVKMRKDLESGGIHLRKLVDIEIKKHENSHHRLCSVCHSEIKPEDVNNFTLVFGPDSFKKKATFCALDCMEYFTTNLRKMREVSDGR